MTWSIASLLVSFMAGYLLGSIPFGLLLTQAAGIGDIRKMGSGNIGATNVLRTGNKALAAATLLLDALKGVVAVLMCGLVGLPAAAAAAVGAVLGHMFPVWLRFKGGKGVATSAGVVFGLMPLAVVIVFLIWVLVFEITRYVSVASIAAALALPVTVALLMHWQIIEGIGLFYFSALLAILVVWSHRTNFSRLLKGTEQRFTRK